MALNEPQPGVTVYATWRVYDTRDGLPGVDIRALRVAEDAVWVGTERGAARLAGGVWTSWTQGDGWPAPLVTAIDVDPATGDVWLGTWGYGLFRLSAGRFDRFDQMNSGLAGNLVFSVAWFQGRVWAATNGGLSSFDPFADAWNLDHAQRADRPTPTVTSLVHDGGDFYGGVWRVGVQRFNSGEGTWVSLPVPATAAAGESRLGIERDTALQIALAEGSLWWPTQSAVYRRTRDASWERWIIPEHIRGEGFISCAASPNDTELWLGTSKGLCVLANRLSDTWLTYRRDADGNGGSVRMLRGAGMLDIRRLATAPPEGQIRCIAFDGNGVWVGTDRGLAYGTDPTPWEALAPPGEGKVDGPAVVGSGTAHPEGSEFPGPVSKEPASPGITILGPRTRTVPLPGAPSRLSARPDRPDLLAVQLAVERANAQGGYRKGVPFELIMQTPGYANYGWGTKEDDFHAFAARQRLVGIVGALDPHDATTDAVALVTEVPVVTVALDNGESEWARPKNPWIFVCRGDQPRRHRLLVDYLMDTRSLTRIALLKTPGAVAQRHLDWWRQRIVGRGRSPAADVACRNLGEDLHRAVSVLRRAEPEAILTWCDARTSAAVLAAVRAAGMGALFVGGKDIVTDSFIALAGADPGPVIAMLGGRADGSTAPLPRFNARYAARQSTRSGKKAPGRHAYRSFEAADHLLAAVRIGGANRTAVRRILDIMSRSVMGEVHYERLHPSTDLTVARLESGGWIIQTHPMKE